MKVRLLRANIDRNESGLALLMTLFVISLAMILIAELSRTSQLDQRAFRSLSEGVQADYGLKSALNFAYAILELPNWPGAGDATWQGEAWNFVSSMPNIPVEGVNGQIRILIVDELGKFPLNSVVSGSGGFSGGTGQPNPVNPGAPIPAGNQAANSWREALRDLFIERGFSASKTEVEKNRTPGNVVLGSADQVAAIVDWIDTDDSPLNDSGFDGQGAEGRGLDKSFFPGRRMARLSDLLLVPGMTLERTSQIASFVNVAPVNATSAKVNVNTASPEVLEALGIGRQQLGNLIAGRMETPLKEGDITELEGAYPTLKNRLTTQSTRFSIYARIEMPSITRWVHAEVSTNASSTRRVIQQKDMLVEFY